MTHVDLYPFLFGQSPVLLHKESLRHDGDRSGRWQPGAGAGSVVEWLRRLRRIRAVGRRGCCDDLPQGYGFR